MFTSSINRIALTGTLLTIVSIAGGCSSIDRLSQIGEKPKLTEIENPTAKPGYKPVQMPMPKPERCPTTPIRCGETVRARSSRTSAPIRSAIS